MTKYHITEAGNPAVCKASVKACPRGGKNDHYPTAKEASQAFEKKMGDGFKKASVDLSAIERIAETGVQFGNSSARNTEVSEAGTQIIAISTAKGFDVSYVNTPEDLVRLTAQLPRTTKNYEELLVMAAKLMNSRQDYSKIVEAVELGTETFNLLRAEKFTRPQIARELRWMAKESTKGDDGTVGDVGIDLPDGKSAHISLKVQSNTLHNASPAQAMTSIGVHDYDPFNSENVKEWDEKAFQIATDYLYEQVENGSDSVTGPKKWSFESVDGDDSIVYREPARKKLMVAPANFLKSLDRWKELGADQQKIMSYFVTHHSKDFAGIHEYTDACRERQYAMNQNLVKEISRRDSRKRKFVARMLGLRNSSAFYVNRKNSGVESGRIPTIKEFIKNKNFDVGDPEVSPTTDSVKIPILNQVEDRVTIIQVRTRLADGQFNYRNVKMTGEYQASKADVEWFSKNPKYRGKPFGSITEVVFNRER